MCIVPLLLETVMHIFEYIHTYIHAYNILHYQRRGIFILTFYFDVEPSVVVVRQMFFDATRTKTRTFSYQKHFSHLSLPSFSTLLSAINFLFITIWTNVDLMLLSLLPSPSKSSTSKDIQNQFCKQTTATYRKSESSKKYCRIIVYNSCRFPDCYISSNKLKSPVQLFSVRSN